MQSNAVQQSKNGMLPASLNDHINKAAAISGDKTNRKKRPKQQERPTAALVVLLSGAKRTRKNGGAALVAGTKATIKSL